MTREELLNLVNKEADTTKFTSLSQKTINEELDDVLEDFGDDEEANSKIVTKLANRLKRMDGNLHKNVSDEMKKNRAEAERKKKKEEDERKKKKEEDERQKQGEGNVDDRYQALEDKLNKLLAANEERDKRAAKQAALDSVRSGLKDKFSKANLEMNDFFLETALSKLAVPDDDADIAELTAKAESIYTTDYKRANGGAAIPTKHVTPGNDTGKVDDHEFDDIIERRKRRFGKVDEKK